MGNSVTQADLKKYVLKSEIESTEFVKTEDLDKLNLTYQTKGNYALSKDLQLIYQTKGNYVLNTDLADYVKSSTLSNYQPKGNYVLNTDLANYQTRGNYILSSDLANYQTRGNYLLTSDLDNYQTRGNYLLSSDLDNYALKSDVSQQDLSRYALKTELPVVPANIATKEDLSNYQTRGNYILSSDLDNYALKSQISSQQDLSKYALKTELPVVPANLATKGDLDNYQPKGNYALKSELPVVPANLATKGDLDNYQPKGDYALKSQISSQQDLSKYALKTELPVVPANIATKGDLANYQPKGDYILNSALNKYALNTDLKNYQLKFDNKLELKDNTSNSNAPFIILNNSAGGAGNQVGIKLNPWSGRAGGDSSIILAEDDGAASSNLVFYTAKGPEGKPTERMRITSDGEVSVKGKLDTSSLSIGGIDLKPANFATKGDLTSYAKTTDLQKTYQAKGDYITKTNLTKELEIYAKETEFDGYTFAPYKTFDTTVSATKNKSFNQCKTLCTNDNNCVAFKVPVTNYKNKTNGDCFIYKEAKPEKSESTSHLFYKN